MPRIPDFVLDGVGFLYPTVEHAEQHARQGGTCFLIGHPVMNGEDAPMAWVPYAVSNRHVVWTGGCPVIRLNRRDGSAPDVIELDTLDWFVHPDGNDVAIACLLGKIDQTVHKISFIPTPRFVTREIMRDWEIGVGDEVFMVGRFVNHQGRTDNLAAARFGTISVMPAPISHSGIMKDQLSYAVEMKSRSGFSGSLVAIYRTVATVLRQVKIDNFFGILGINWGHILDEDGENTWLNGVVPAWEILETLAIPPLAKMQAEAGEQWRNLQLDRSTNDTIPTLITQIDDSTVRTAEITENAIAIALMLS
jgi:hypothetical protein